MQAMAYAPTDRFPTQQARSSKCLACYNKSDKLSPSGTRLEHALGNDRSDMGHTVSERAHDDPISVLITVNNVATCASGCMLAGGGN